jgi:type II secretory pathway component PulF
MPRFNYTARDRSGQSVSAGIEASSRKEALRLLAARGLSPVSVSEATPASGKRPAEAPKKTGLGELLIRSAARSPRSPTSISRKHRLPFLQALSDLTGSGLSAGEAVRLLSQRLQEPALRALCQG